MDMFKLGNIVLIRKDSEFYGKNKIRNPADVEGIITNIRNITTGFKYEVKWSTDFTNDYREQDLELVFEGN